MKIVYIVLAHKHPKQLIRLIDRLNTEATSFFIHIDRKANDETYQQIVNHLSNLSNVYFLRRQNIYWGEFSIVKATVEGIKEILSKNIPFDYAVLLSGQDYPIKSNSQIEKFLQKNEGKSFIKYFRLPCYKRGEYGGLERIEYLHVPKYIFNIPAFPLLWSFLAVILPAKRNFPKGFEPFGGSQHWCLSRECIKYIDKFVKENRTFVNFFRYVQIPDEIFFHTIILNSPFRDSLINVSLKYIDWSDSLCHPATLCKKDYEIIINSSKLFARKFDIEVDVDILDMIDRTL